jgi:predicted transposase/invertase (TIGR01784 family)
VIELSKLKSTKGKARKQELYRWAKLISASTWEEVREESEGNHYMEKVRDEMIKMSRDESERYLYLREQMAIRDKVSQLRSAENRGRREGREEGRKQGEVLKLITMVKKKIENGDSVAKIADDLLEDADVIEKIYDIVKENPEKTREEIWDSLMNDTMIEM